MKKYIILFLFALLLPCYATAQSSMTDEQILKFVMKENAEGTSQAQIVTKLMQKGVTIEQIRRVKDKYERQAKNKGLGTVSSKDTEEDNGRQRKNNGKKGSSKNDDDEESPQYRIKDTREKKKSKSKEVVYDETNEDWLMMQDELNTFIPDTTAMLEKLLAEKRKKKVFGRDIFNNKDLTFEPNMNIATPQNYILGPGDAVYIDIYGASQKTIESTVSPDGEVTIEGFGPVQVSGLTVAQANARLRSTLGARYSSSKIKLTVGQTRSIMINVMGEVKNPGTYTLPAFATVFHALYMAGGTNDIGTMRNIKVYRNNRLVSVVDIYDYILNGKLTGNVRLADNDVISVGPYDCLVNITGKVKRPMYYEMKRNESVGTLLKYAGGFTGDAYKKSVRIVRKTGREYSVYNVDEFDMSAFHLADEDSVSVDSILPRFSNMVEVKGAVFRPGMYQVGGDINSVKTLIEHADGLREEAFTARAVMHRMKKDRTLEVVPVDVEGILDGTVPDIPIQNNDVLFIPTKQEMMEEQTITIHGEVQYPGIYRYADNETLEDFVLQAGGLKQTASTVKVDVSRRIVNPKALTTDSVIARTYTFALKDGFVIDGTPGFKLMPFDEVYVRKSPGYYKQQNVVVEGEVMFSGTYTLSKKNQRLSDLIKSAGGVNDRGYIAGARLERKVNESERARMEAVLKKAKEEAEQMEIEAAKENKKIDLKDSEKIKKFEIPEFYSVGIELDKALANPGCDADIVLREGDKIIVPQYNGTVKINGAVMYPNTVGFQKGKKAKYYINQAGGFSEKAKKSQTYIVYMNGTIAKVSQNAKPKPGCEIVVPEKEINKMTIAEKMTIGTSVASIATMIATLANIL
ncbi:SLBB domain-containing protein [Prevotella sp. CAG:255]|uniref:SLBB domain-containing protein n=1 Tax=Prevotellaceae TaxID=171552 RepID=UPI00034093FD|nr:SLBB domain-containing protein [Prevotella sp. CAG:255]CCX68181.1 polysaccharide biosynthesis/export protein [Prevotella sp. CAG:255]HJH77815.1 SLBB domain-containing protein [Prevotellaceae bacterium]